MNKTLSTDIYTLENINLDNKLSIYIVCRIHNINSIPSSRS